jgi:hypothetical protein
MANDLVVTDIMFTDLEKPTEEEVENWDWETCYCYIAFEFAG